MRITRQLLVATLMLGLGASCGSSPRLVDYPLAHSDSEFEQIFSAPIVVIGVIVSDTLSRRPIPSHWDPDTALQLRRLDLRVENSLRGVIGAPRVTVYYFGFAGGFDGSRPLGIWNIAKRRVFWLRRDMGVLRTACDGFDYCTMPVGSGAHPYYQADPHKPLGIALADIWFTRGVNGNARNSVESCDSRVTHSTTPFSA